MEQFGSKIRVAYCDASDGPRLMIFGPSGAEFRSLNQLFVRLGKSPGMSCQLEREPFVVAFGGVQARLHSPDSILSSNSSGRFGIVRVRDESAPVFEWEQSAEEWGRLAELIESLATSLGPGHQYLTAYPSEDAIVVVSKGEYGDDVLKRL